MKGIFLALLAVSSPAAAQQNKFDLKCEGWGQKISAKPTAKEALIRELHVDLDLMEFCVDSCPEIKKIFDVSSQKIVFVDNEVSPRTAGYIRDFEKVDRTNGKHQLIYINMPKLDGLVGETVCSPAAFTPFPKAKF